MDIIMQREALALHLTTQVQKLWSYFLSVCRFGIEWWFTGLSCGIMRNVCVYAVRGVGGLKNVA